MTDPPTGRYQSQVLSFFSRQSQKLLGRSQVALREWGDRAIWNLRVAATWGSQILLYPIYATFQATRLVGRQLQQAVQQTLPRLQAWRSRVETQLPRSNPIPAQKLSDRVVLAIDPALTQAELPGTVPTTDAPIRHILQTIMALPAPELPVTMLSALAQLPAGGESTAPLVWSPAGGLSVQESAGCLATHGNSSGDLAKLESATEVAIRPPLLIQGVATLVESRRLVLVTAHNQILDILTAEQQEKLRQRITWEVAGYWRAVRLFWDQQQPIAPLPLPKINQPHLLPPVRLFRQLMAWVQTGPVAVSTNLFQEIALHLRSQQAQLLALAGIESPAHFWLPAADGAFPDNSAEAEAWLMLGDPWSKNSHRALDDTVPLQSTVPAIASAQKPKAEVSGLSPTIALAPIPAAALPPAPTLQTGLHHFGKGLMQTLLQQSQGVLAKVERSSMQNPVAAPKEEPKSGALKKINSVTQANGLQNSDQSPKSFAKSAAKRQHKGANLSIHLPQSQLVHATAGAGTAVTPSSLERSTLSNNIPTAAPDWIETHATLSGYVKHPLEVLLEWVDRILLGLEKLITLLWNWIRQRA
ncbi:MAG: hypothetical protein KME16_01110 [Scytolyngbya sp. HA4215-MV1]|jgi:hypothetical protein|nr:hypothetical protein [Scytolyngbya sp. HA4215-MV1]